MIDSRRRRSGGFSLVELMVALGVLALALAGLMSVITHTISAKEGQKDLARAKESVESTIETIRNQPFSSMANYLVTTYGTPTTTPPAPSTAPTSPLVLYFTFPVKGLSYQPQGVRWTPTAPPATLTGLGRGTIRVDTSNSSLLEAEVSVEWIGTERYTKYSMRALYQP